MTTTTQPATGADSNGDPATVGGITRLNATDGLFLRAEHLTAMQDYARELAHAAGLANGTGVVHGFTVTLTGEARDTLEVLPGLAIDPTGRPLRSRKTARVSLADLTIEHGLFWVLEIVPAQWRYGTEKAFGNLCDDPCNGSTIVPWQAEGLTIQLRRESMNELGGQCQGDRRNWLASQYFEQERQRGGPWLTPSESVNSTMREDWAKGSPEPAPTAVPLAVVQHVNNQWVLDVWTARRDLGDPPARRTWQWRLGMRPWNVFLAQILQFQAQLATVLSSSAEAQTVDPDKLITNLDEFVQGMTVKPKQLRAMVDALKKAAPTLSTTVGGPALRNQGFVELPPAGFLPVIGGASSAIGAFFGEHVKVRICHCRADYIPNAIEQAQHLDRIPLLGSAEVDVLVPTDPNPQAGTGYGWVAFVRRSGCEPSVDEVDVYLVDGDEQLTPDLEPDKLQEILTDGNRSRKLGKLEYPVGTWAYPGGQDLINELDLTASSRIIIFALTNEENRRPLAALRASLFAACFDKGLFPSPIVAMVDEDYEREAIVVAKRKVASD